MSELDEFEGKWNKKYPKIGESWREKWVNLSIYFNYPEQVRELIYTTNAIENFNRQLRKVTKSKFVFPTDDSLIKNAVPGDDGHNEKVDRQTSGVGYDSFPIEGILCSQDSRLSSY